MRISVVVLTAAVVVASCAGGSDTASRAPVTDEVVAPSTTVETSALTPTDSTDGTDPDGTDPDGTEPDGSEQDGTESTDAVPRESPPSETVTPSDAGVQPEGFTTATVRITKADGTTCDVCMWLADTPDEQGRGLMGVTSLGDAQGMAFLFEQPRNGAFFMFQTITPLSIAWFAPDGGFVSATDMDPCTSEDSGLCERFPAGGEYQLAIEVFQGDLESVGVTSGARAEILAGTEAMTCPLQS